MDLDHDACYRAIELRDARFDGRFFVAVKTTGIYCRPVCPARTPRSENVTFYPTAAAAQEAGFRPCLRCRPETAPDMGAWRGTSNTVSRALALIELGALDEGDVDALAGRLGVGERQLRRLFAQHLGASPIAVAQTRRVLLAKQLIHETSLPMAEVAFASGFGSIRRFNETFLALFGRAPCTLRRGSAPEVPAGPGGEISLLLRYQPPYDWPGMLGFLRRRAVSGIERVSERCYSRTIELDGRQGMVSVRPEAGHALRARIRFPKLSALPGIIARLRRVFDLAADPLPIAAHLAKDPALAPLVAARPGLRVPGAWDGFELAIRAVLGQQITVAAAVRLAGTPGGHVRGAPGGAGSRADPRLPAAGGPGARGPDDASACRGAGRPRYPPWRPPSLADPDVLCASRGLDEAIRRLRVDPGSGRMDGALHRPAPAAGAGRLSRRRRRARCALARLEGRRPSSRELVARAEAWRPWRAYAAQHLWASLGRDE